MLLTIQVFPTRCCNCSNLWRPWTSTSPHRRRFGMQRSRRRSGACPNHRKGCPPSSCNPRRGHSSSCGRQLTLDKCGILGAAAAARCQSELRNLATPALGTPLACRQRQKSISCFRPAALLLRLGRHSTSEAHLPPEGPGSQRRGRGRRRRRRVLADSSKGSGGTDSTTPPRSSSWPWQAVPVHHGNRQRGKGQGQGLGRRSPRPGGLPQELAAVSRGRRRSRRAGSLRGLVHGAQCVRRRSRPSCPTRRPSTRPRGLGLTTRATMRLPRRCGRGRARPHSSLRAVLARRHRRLGLSRRGRPYQGSKHRWGSASTGSSRPCQLHQPPSGAAAFQPGPHRPWWSGLPDRSLVRVPASAGS